MGKKWEPVFDDAIGCKGNHINSALVSAQTRKRIYWTNIQGGIIPQPKDEGLTISDIAEYEVDEKYYLSEKVLNNLAFHLKEIMTREIIMELILKQKMKNPILLP